MASSGNFCTLNPLSTKGVTLSRGNIRADSTFYWATYYGTIALPTSGKWYAECRTPNISGPDASFPMGIQDAQLLTYLGDKTSNGNPQYIGMATSTAGEGYSIYTHANGTYSKKYYNGSSSDTSLASASNGDIYQIAVDLDNNKLWFGKNNTWDQSNPSGNGTATYTITNKSYVMGGSASSSEYHIWNFGQDSTFGGGVSAGGNADDNGFGDFKYSPPTGFLAVCTANLPISDDIDPAQTDDNIPIKQFGVVTYTGNASTNNITGLNFKPDLVWIKIRNTASNAVLVDSTRGTNKMLHPNNTNDEVTTANLTSFNSNGFSLDGTSDYQANYNGNGNTYVAWCWRANGGTTASNSDGDITSTIQANTNAGFSIVKFTSNNSSNQTVGHGLGAIPRFILVKPLTGGGWSWWVYHYNDGTLGYLKLAGADSFTTGTAGFGAHPTSSVFTMGSVGNSMPNDTSTEVIAYVWADVEGFQKFGTYEGNGSADGTFIYTGFRPRMVFLKQIDGAAEWTVFDTARETHNQMEDILQWDLDNAETQLANDKIDFLSNGFKLRGAGGGRTNQSGRTFVYGAWGDVSFKYGNTFP